VSRMSDFAQETAREIVCAMPGNADTLPSIDYVAAIVLRCLDKRASPDLDTLAREIALGFWRKHWISEPDVFPVTEKDKQRVDRFQDEAQAIIAPYFAARAEREAKVQEALKLCVIELAYLKEQVKARPGGSVDRAHQAGTKALALLAKEKSA